MKIKGLDPFGGKFSKKLRYIEDITWLHRGTNFSSTVEKIFHVGAQRTNEIFFNTRREISYLQVTI